MKWKRTLTLHPFVCIFKYFCAFYLLIYVLRGQILMYFKKDEAKDRLCQENNVLDWSWSMGIEIHQRKPINLYVILILLILHQSLNTVCDKLQDLIVKTNVCTFLLQVNRIRAQKERLVVEDLGSRVGQGKEQGVIYKQIH